MIPVKAFLTNGVGRGRDELTSFAYALRDAGIEKCNLVTVSSILPPQCEIVSRSVGEDYLRDGEITYAVLSRKSTNEPARLIAASVGCAIPADAGVHGYLSEHHSFGEDEQQAGEQAEDLAAAMLASTLGIAFDVNQGWNEREQVFTLTGRIVRTMSSTQTALGGRNGHWTSVVAAAVLLLPHQVERGPRGKR